MSSIGDQSHESGNKLHLFVHGQDKRVFNPKTDKIKSSVLSKTVSQIFGERIAKFLGIQQVKIEGNTYYLSRSDFKALAEKLPAFKEDQIDQLTAESKAIHNYQKETDISNLMETSLQEKVPEDKSGKSEEIYNEYAKNKKDLSEGKLKKPASLIPPNKYRKNTLQLVGEDINQNKFDDLKDETKLARVNSPHREFRYTSTGGLNQVIIGRAVSAFRCCRSKLNKLGFKNNLKHGEAVRTIGEKGSHLIHAQSAQYDPKLTVKDQLPGKQTEVYNATMNALKLAKKSGIKHVQMSLMSCGSYAKDVPKNEKEAWIEGMNKAQMQAISDFFEQNQNDEMHVMIMDLPKSTEK